MRWLMLGGLLLGRLLGWLLYRRPTALLVGGVVVVAVGGVVW